MNDRERRVVATPTLRAGLVAQTRHEAGGPVIEGYAAIFGVEADVGSFKEEIAPGAFAGVLADDVRALFNHDPNHILGRTASGTLSLRQDSRGLWYRVAVNTGDADAVKLWQRIQRGDIDGNSFSFAVEAGGEEWGYRNGRRLRTIKRVSRLYDVGPVTFPAYEATEVSARAEAMARRKPSPETLRWLARARARLEALEDDDLPRV